MCLCVVSAEDKQEMQSKGNINLVTNPETTVFISDWMTRSSGHAPFFEFFSPLPPVGSLSRSNVTSVFSYCFASC